MDLKRVQLKIKTLIVRLMYAISMFLVICMVTVTADSGQAQASMSVREMYFTAQFENDRLQEVFNELEQQNDLKIVQNHMDYNSRQFRKNKITKDYYNTPVYEVLMDLSEIYGIGFKQVNKNLNVRLLADDHVQSAAAVTVVEQVNEEVTGLVTDENGEALPGASILVKGTTNGTVSDIEGKYTISVSRGETLVFSFIGYSKKEVIVTDRTTIDVQLQVDAEQLKEVVVIGYGTQKRANVTGAVAQLKAKSIDDLPVRALDEAIAGQLAGVNVVQATGSPGSTSNIQIRGVGTISAGTTPLLVVDGFPSENISLNDINPNDIESIEVLKDAASASIYGSRAANGVILLTTKKGSDNGIRLNFNAYGGTQQVTQTYDMADAYEWAEYQTEMAVQRGIWNADGSNFPALYQPYLAGTPGLIDTDWQDEIFRKAAIQNYQVSIAGGNEKTKFYVSGDFFDQEGIVIGSDYKRYSFRANVSSKILDNSSAAFLKSIDFGINLVPTYSINNRVSESHHNNDGIVITGLYLYPNLAPYAADGSYNISEAASQGLFAGFENPVAVALERKNPVKRANILTSTYLDFELIEGLNFKTYFGYNYTNEQDRLYRPSLLGKRNSPAPSIASGSSNTWNSLNWINENTLTYSKSINDTHNFSVLLGQSYLTETWVNTSINGQDFPNDDVQTLNAAASITAASVEEEPWALKSYFGRLQYDFKGKYLLSASLRRDGSSRFGTDSKWGTFPAVSVGWRVSEESFLQGVSGISDLKLRASYGKVGNDRIPNFGAQALMQPARYDFSAGVQGGLSPATIPNPNTSWEETDQFDIGFDMGLFGDKVFLIADYYSSTTDGMLLDVPVPSQSGYLTSLQNLGVVKNKGFEFTVSARDINLGPVKWSGSFNISSNKNEVVELGPGQEQIISKFHKTEIGQPLGEFYVFNILGVFNTQAEIDATPSLDGAQPGDYIWEDVNGDGEITDDDRRVLGNAFPDFIYGFNSTFEFKGIDLGVVIQGSKGAESVNFTKFFLTRRGDFANVTSDRVQGRWQSASQPGTGWARSGATERYYDRSSYIVEDASYLRIRNITLGYTFPSTLTEKLQIQRARVYFSSLNPFTFTDFSGYNPEATTTIGLGADGSPLEPGVDWANYPTARTFTLGINLTF